MCASRGNDLKSQKVQLGIRLRKDASISAEWTTLGRRVTTYEHHICQSGKGEFIGWPFTEDSQFRRHKACSEPVRSTLRSIDVCAALIAK